MGTIRKYHSWAILTILLAGCAGPAAPVSPVNHVPQDNITTRFISGPVRDFDQIAAFAQSMADVQIFYEPTSQMIIVKGSAAECHKVGWIFDSLEPHMPYGEFTPVIFVYRLDNARAEDIVAILRPAFEQGWIRKNPMLAPRIFAVSEPNAVLISAEENNVDAIVALIKELDLPLHPSAKTPATQGESPAATH